MTNGNILVIGTILDGIIALDMDGEEVFRFNMENGLENNTVLGLMTDKFGNIWIGLDRGIGFIDVHADPGIEMVNRSELGAVYSAALYKNYLYLATNQGLYRRSWDQPRSEFSLVPGTQGQVWDCKTYDGLLFIGHNFGTFVHDGNTLRKISDVTGGYHLIPHPSDPGRLFQCTYTSIVIYKQEGGQWKRWQILKNFSNLIRYMEIDHRNNIWASHLYRGIYRLMLNDKQDSVVTTNYYGAASFGGHENKLHVFRVENRIVFTTGERLYTYDDIQDSIVPYDFLNNQLGDYASSILIAPASNHQYWMIGNNGVARFLIRGPEVKKTGEFPLAMFRNQMIQGYENLVPLSDDRALLCLENGYALLDPSMEMSRDSSLDLVPVIREIQYSGKDEKMIHYPLDERSVILSFKRNNLQLRYAFPTHSQADISFQYMIQGLTPEWSQPQSIPDFSAKRIPVGEYFILVKATNTWGQSSTSHPLRVKVLPPWYRSSLAYILYAVLFVILLYVFRLAIVRRIRKLEGKRQEEQEKELIRLRNEKLRAEVSHKSQELANATMAMIRKNEFLLELKELMKSQKEELGTRYPDKYIQQLLTRIDRNISSDDDWKVFEDHFEKAHEQFLNRLMTSFPDLTHSDLRLCAYLRMNLSSKEIAPLLRISVRGVENHRYRIRKKLGLAPEENLTEFIMAF